MKSLEKNLDEPWGGGGGHVHSLDPSLRPKVLYSPWSFHSFLSTAPFVCGQKYHCLLSNYSFLFYDKFLKFIFDIFGNKNTSVTYSNHGQEGLCELFRVCRTDTKCLHRPYRVKSLLLTTQRVREDTLGRNKINKSTRFFGDLWNLWAWTLWFETTLGSN